jgi:hypothetical protein
MSRAATIVCAVAISVATLGAAPAPAPSGGPASSEPTAADALFAKTRAARSESAYAHYTVYATVMRFRSGARETTSTWMTIEDMRRRLVYARSLSVEEAEHPHVPRGINVGISVGPSGPIYGIPPKGQVTNHEPVDDPFGQLSFAVDQDFGLALNAPPIAATNDMSDVSSAATTLPRIGRTGTVARTYEVTDLGDVVEGEVTLHHLGLRPLREPKRNRLRELWTDAKTSLPVRAVVAGVGNRSPLQDVRWRVDFTQLQGGTYIARETALEPLVTSIGPVAEATITFAQVRPTNRLAPDELVGLSGDVGTTDP